MGSPDVDSLFNIPLEDTINICTNTLFENTESVKGLSKIEIKELVPLASIESYFIFSFLIESSTSRLMELLWVHLQVRPWLMLFV